MADIHELVTIHAAADDGNAGRAITTIYRETEDNSGVYMPVVAVGAVTGAEVTLTGDIVVDTLGALNNAKTLDPDAASATIPALLRGILANQATIIAALGAASDNAGTATVIGLLKSVAANTAPS